jgi:hypothetical protein
MASDLAPSPSTAVLPLTRPSPPRWIFGVLILLLGMYLGFIWTALPFLLSKAGSRWKIFLTSLRCSRFLPS